MKKIKLEEIEKHIGKHKFLFLAGNGGSGKTTFANNLKAKIEAKGGIVNIISMDDFIVDTTLRRNSITTWQLNGEKYVGRYTSCCEGSYFLRGVLPILQALKEGKDAYILPKRSEMQRLRGDANLTIVEGIGVVFLPKEGALRIWFECDKQTELKRRNLRDKNLSPEEIEKAYNLRTSQFKANIEPFKKDFDFLVDTSE